jgi:hypothetical protein
MLLQQETGARVPPLRANAARYADQCHSCRDISPSYPCPPRNRASITIRRASNAARAAASSTGEADGISVAATGGQAGREIPREDLFFCTARKGPGFGRVVGMSK